MKHLSYKSYFGSIEYSPEDGLLFGKVLGIRSLISYEGKSGKELEQNFCESIDEYLQVCKDGKMTPEKPYKGSFNVRLSPELHQKAAMIASDEKVSLNHFVAESIRDRVMRRSSEYRSGRG